jgi:hypothetical protein
VNTGSLIVEEAKEIGYMSDRIVHTADSMANLTEFCMCDKSNPIERVSASFAAPPPPVMVSEPFSFESAAGLAVLPSAARCSPLSDFNSLLNHSMVAFFAVAEDMTEIMHVMIHEIGVMADRIVATECLIMDMSKQIGVMADRIVTTEELMFSLTASCCQPSKSETQLLPNSRSLQYVPLSECDEYISSPNSSGGDFFPTALSKARDLTRSAAWTFLRRDTQRVGKARSLMQVGMPCNTWWNPFCCAMEMMMSIFNSMVDMMMDMGSRIAEMMVEGARLIGNMADDIVLMEKAILEMGLVIGDAADLIVEINTLMLGFAESTMCAASNDSGTMPSTTIDHSERNNIYLELNSSSLAIRTHLHQLQAHISRATTFKTEGSPHGGVKTAAVETAAMSPFGNFAEMVNVMTSMASTMGSLMVGQLGIWGDITDGMIAMTGKIREMMGLIKDMADEIIIMMGRMQETREIMARLVSSCTS